MGKKHRYPSKGRNRPNNNAKSSTPTIVVEKPPEQVRRQPKIPPGGVNFVPMGDKIIGQMYQNMGPQAQQDPYYAPGAPIRPVPGLTPQEGPRGFAYEQGYNIAQLPRGTEEYSFNDLRAIAAASDFIQMCEQVWFDYISKLELTIEPRPELVGEDGDTSQYDNDIQYYKDFFAFPDKHHDLKEWMRMLTRDQLEIDAAAIFVRKNRIGGVYALDILDGSTIKPLVTDRGRRPDPPFPAYEQFVYGVPACLLTSDDLIYVKETERTESVYGKSRVEKIIFRIMMELRKQSKDLARFTDGSLPGGFISQAPDSVDWTQEEVEDYESQLNDQLAGNDVMRARIKVLPRGFSWEATDDPDIHVDLDMLILNLVAAMFGLSMDELAITLNSNRSVGDSQENMIYRRVMQPLMDRYAQLLMQVLKKYFNESRFIIKWKGYEEQEDFTTKATGFATLVGSGIQSPTQAAREMGLQVYNNLDIGPYVITKSGPSFLEDAADPKIRQAQKAAQLAGLQAATQNPQPAQPSQDDDTEDENEDSEDETEQSDSQSQEDEESTSGKAGSKATDAKQEAEDDGKSASTAKSSNEQKPATKDSASTKRADTGDQHHTGIMVAFMLDSATAQQLALPGGEPPDQLHCTLTFMGDMTDDPPQGKLNPAETRDIITTALSTFATCSAPLEGSVGGIGRFTPSESSDGFSPIIALVNVLGLQDFRRRLVSVLDNAGYWVAQNFEYQPHITLMYANAAQRIPADYIDNVPLRFDTLCLAIGDERQYFPLGGMNERNTANTIQPSNRNGQISNTRRDEHREHDIRDGDNSTATDNRSSIASTDIQRTEHDPSELARARSNELRKWCKRALSDIERNRSSRPFESDILTLGERTRIEDALKQADNSDAVKEIFKRAYNPDQPRDSHGRWGDGDGSTDSSSSSSSSIDIEELAESMSTKYPHTMFDFSGCDPEMAGKAAAQIDTLMEKYPDVGKSINYIGTPDWAPDGWSPDFSLEANAGAMASCTSNVSTEGAELKSCIILNPDYFGDSGRMQDALGEASESNWLSGSSVEETMTHEFGHATQFYLMKEGQGQSFTGYIGEDGEGEVSHTINEFTGENQSKASGTSGYAATDEREGFAEGFSMMNHKPESEQSEYAKGLKNILGKVFPGGSKSSWKSATPEKLTPAQRANWMDFGSDYIYL